jgi:hypothetical protein
MKLKSSAIEMWRQQTLLSFNYIDTFQNNVVIFPLQLRDVATLRI